MKRLIKIGLLAAMMPGLASKAQDSAAAKEHKLSVNGYIKNLQSLTFDKDFSEVVAGNLLHNRINVKWKPVASITAAAELRNRVFWGEELKITPGYPELLKNQSEVFDLSKAWINNTGFLLHTNVERLWAEYSRPKWNIRLGRQRINWGIATNWNPNDIFNTYNFLDFDYEERPGSDAVKAQYLFNDFSHIEIASNLSGKKDKRVTAAKFFLNRFGYDWQLLAGVYQDKFTIGTGWAGSIGEAGFKGEAQLFVNGKDSGTSFNFIAEGDYFLEEGWYVNGAVLYSGNGVTRPVQDWAAIDFSPSPVKLMPTRWNIVLTGAKEITPLFSARLSTVYAPGVNLLILVPSFTYSLAENLDVDLIGQSFFSELQQRMQGVGHRVFLRIKWSF